MKSEKIVKKGTFLYDNTIICDLQIIETNIRLGTGDSYDLPDIRDDKEGNFYYVKFGSPQQRGVFNSSSFYFDTLKEAIQEAERLTKGLTWRKQKEDLKNERRYSYPVSKNIVKRISGNLALPSIVEKKVITELSVNKRYSEEQLMNLLIKEAIHLGVKINSKHLNKLTEDRGINLNYNPYCHTCPECKSKDLFKDQKKKETVCKNCGLVLDWLTKPSLRRKHRNHFTMLPSVPILTGILIAIFLPFSFEINILAAVIFSGLLYLIISKLIKMGVINV